MISRLQKSLAPRAALLAALVLLPALARPASAKIVYKVSLADRTTHMFQVTMTVPDVHGQVVVAMPAWNATYVMRDFAERVEDVRASAAGKALPVWALTGDTWRITGNGTVQIRYRIYWDSPGPFSTQLDKRQAFINFAEILFYVPSRRKETSEVQFTGIPAGWRIAVELPKAADCPTQACYEAGNYDLLVDAPAEAGKFTEFRFNENGAHLRVVMVAMGGARWNQEQLEGWLKKIVKYETGMMRVVPFKQYLFIYHIGPGAGGGGMEHSNGTAIAVPEFSEIPAVTAHEFFHLWNVKRIRPQSLTPYDYEHPMWTRSLWFAEGVTSTYAAYTMVRSGLWTPKRYYAHLSQMITELQSKPARHWQSVEESSLDTWYGKYSFYNRPGRSISYYNKGELVGVLLDLRIREVTNNRKSLDSVMRYMYAQYPAKHRYYDGTAAIEAAVDHVAGRSLGGFFRRYVAGTADIAWSRVLGRAGLGVNTEQVAVADPGFRWTMRRGQAIVSEVEPGGAAAKAGLKEGDVLISAGGAPPSRYPEFWAREHEPGETVQLRIERAGRSMTLPLTFGRRNVTLYRVTPLANPTPTERRILNGLLNGTTN